MSLSHHLRTSLRTLRRAPVFTVAVVSVLALTIGANVAVFAVVHATLLRPLPFGDPDRLVTLSESHPESGQERAGVLPGSFLDWRQRSGAFENIALFWTSPVVVTNREEPIRGIAASVSPNFFDLLEVEPIMGRTFPASDDAIVGHEREIVLSHGAWQRWFGGDPDVVGRLVEVQGRIQLTVVGVMPSEVEFPRGADLWRPEVWHPSYGRGEPNRWRRAVGRLRSGVELEAAERELRAIGEQLAVEFPETNAGWTATVEPLSRTLTGDVRAPLGALLLAVTLLFLLACVNVAALVLQRGLARQREWATRVALGADTRRLLGASLVEHGVLALAGFALGGLVASVIVRQLLAVAPPGVLRWDGLVIDLRLIAYLAAVAFVGIAFTGALPVLSASRVQSSAALRSGNISRRVTRGWRTLIVAELALAVTLLSGAGLMIRTMLTLQRVELGIEPAGVLTTDMMLPVGRITAPQSQRPNWDRLIRFYGDVVDEVEADPGVVRAALVAAPSLAGIEATWLVRAGNFPPQLDSSPEWQPIQHRAVTPGYFDVLRLPLLRGRAFSDQDRAVEFLRPESGRQAGVAIVNRAAARQLWSGDDPVGQVLTIGGDMRVDGRIVVGLSADARDLAPDREPQPTVYVPFAESPDLSITLLARQRSAGSATPAAVRARLRAMDTQLMIGDVRPLVDHYASTLAPRRFLTVVLTAFAAFGILLAAVGLYGLMAAAAVRRGPEFALRIALGAKQRHIQEMVLGEAGLVVGMGVALGAVGSWIGTRLLRSQLFGIETFDPKTWIGTLLVLALASLAAAWLPAWRASRSDPGSTLRVQ